MLTNHESMLIFNTTITNVVGQDKAALIFTIQNEQGIIHFESVHMSNCIGMQSIIGMTYARIKVKNSIFMSNFAVVAAAIAMIQSDAEIENVMISNLENPY